jgi:sucrose-6-phosphate hydrolase SacC (GH32 family)
VKPGTLTFADTTHSSLNAMDGHAASLVSAPLLPSGLPLDSVRVRVFVDGSVVESFFADGRTAITRRAYPTRPGACTLALVAGTERPCMVSYVQAWELSL